MPRRIAIIPARGGSKRIPRKNIIDFQGLPMIAWTIRAAIGSGAFAHVIVSTEDEEIAAVSRAHGAEAPFLRDSHYDDVSTVSQATVAALAQAKRHYGEPFDIVVQLMANCPLRDSDDIRAGLKSFEAAGSEFQLSCFRFGWMNPWWALTLDASGQGAWAFPEASGVRSQDLPPLYCPTGAIWIARTEALRAAQTFYGPGHRFQPVSWIAAVDIDDEEDLAFARAAFAIKSVRNASVGVEASSSPATLQRP